MSKYIIDIGDAYVRHALGRKLIIPVIINNDTEYWVNTNIQLTLYTEPDTEKVREEAYDKGYQDATVKISSDEQAIADKAYQSGLSDAWEAARKISSIMDPATRDEIFGLVITSNIFDENTASEAIEKLNAFEQKQEELGIQGYFKNGEEVIDADGTKAVILRVSEDNYCQVYTEKDCIENWHIHTYKFHKTGRYFPEIATVLEKMRGGQNE